MAMTSNSGVLSYASVLRQELSRRSREYACRLSLEHREGRGEPPVVCYVASEQNRQHGNFLQQSYRAILNNNSWRKRLEKPHTSAYEALPREGLRWHELDSCNSSDALLMNIFCYPGVTRRQAVCNLLATPPGSGLEFGFKARVPLANGRTDRTEVDMRLDDLLVEAKLTEANFQSKAAEFVESYRDFEEVFDARELPRQNGSYGSYQLIRNVLAAHATACRFCLMMDARRPDLRESWYAVIRCIRLHDLRLRCKLLTWQELSATLPRRVQDFLAEKYGILAGEVASQAFMRNLAAQEIA